MENYNYDFVQEFVHDADLRNLLCLDRELETLMDYLLRDDFLSIDEGIHIPFFAETRDYIGAREKDDHNAVWIIKQVQDADIINTEMATICFFLDIYTHTISAPQVITRIHGAVYKATRLIRKAEQLTGAHYTERKQLKEQLLLDIVNRWIFFDEDRNPNNYMIKYNSRNNQIVIAIDFLNADLLASEIKIKGTEDKFGWERMEKTRYLTPLKSENCTEYSIDFFNIRFNRFRKLTLRFIEDICKKVLRLNPQKNSMSKTIAENIIRRVDYLYTYFSGRLPGEQKKSRKYSTMGKTFEKVYGSSKKMT